MEVSFWEELEFCPLSAISLFSTSFCIGYDKRQCFLHHQHVSFAHVYRRCLLGVVWWSTQSLLVEVQVTSFWAALYSFDVRPLWFLAFFWSPIFSSDFLVTQMYLTYSFFRWFLAAVSSYTLLMLSASCRHFVGFWNISLPQFYMGYSVVPLTGYIVGFWILFWGKLLLFIFFYFLILFLFIKPVAYLFVFWGNNINKCA